MPIQAQELKDKVAIITGAAQGIGKAIAHQFLNSGIKVIIADIDTEAGEETEKEYKSLGEIKYIPTDIASKAEVKALIEQTISTFNRLDILVNNAAIANPENTPIEQLSLEEWNQIINVNLTGVFLCSKWAISHLRITSGNIINIASTRALMSEPNTEAYSTAKGGIIALTHSLANSLAPLIRVNCISPGWINTSTFKKTSAPHTALTEQDHQQHLVGRVGIPEDIADMVLYLASEKAGFITGANFIIDGGMTRKMIYL